MEWLKQNWIWLAAAAFIVWMFIGNRGAQGGHGGCCGGGGHGHEGDAEEGRARDAGAHEHARP